MISPERLSALSRQTGFRELALEKVLRSLVAGRKISIHSYSNCEGSLQRSKQREVHNRWPYYY